MDNKEHLNNNQSVMPFPARSSNKRKEKEETALGMTQ